MSRPDPFIEAAAAMEAEFPGYFVQSVDAAMAYCSRDRNDEYKPNVGSYHRYNGARSSWGVTVRQEGWDYESEQFIEWAATPLDALAAVVEHMRQRRDDPHSAHIEDKVLLVECRMCVEDCDRLDIDRAELEREREMVLG